MVEKTEMHEMKMWRLNSNLKVFWESEVRMRESKLIKIKKRREEISTFTFVRRNVKQNCI